MARVLEIHKVDNGYFLQTLEKEGSPLEGLMIAPTAEEVLALAAAKLSEIEGVEVALGSKVVGYVGKETTASGEEAPPADPELNYEEELKRMVADNDRDAGHARLKVLVDAGKLEQYKPRISIKTMVDLIRKGDHTVVDAAPTLPSGAPLPEGVPAPTPQTDPLAVVEEVITIADVSAALQAAAARTDAATAFAVLKNHNAAKVTDLHSSIWDVVIAEANATGL